MIQIEGLARLRRSAREASHSIFTFNTMQVILWITLLRASRIQNPEAKRIAANFCKMYGIYHAWKQETQPEEDSNQIH